MENSYYHKDSVMTGFKKLALALSALLTTVLASQAMARTVLDAVGE